MILLDMPFNNHLKQKKKSKNIFYNKMVSFKQIFPTEAWSWLVWDCQCSAIEIIGVCVLTFGIGGELWNSSISLWLFTNLALSVKHGFPRKADDRKNMNKSVIKWPMFWNNIHFKIEGIPLNMDIFLGMPEKFFIALLTVDLKILPHCFPSFFNLKFLYGHIKKQEILGKIPC